MCDVLQPSLGKNKSIKIRRFTVHEMSVWDECMRWVYQMKNLFFFEIFRQGSNDSEVESDGKNF